MITEADLTERNVSQQPRIAINTVRVEFTDDSVTKGCPVGDYAHMVDVTNISPERVARLVQFAQIETRRIGGKCSGNDDDLKHFANDDTFQIAHGIEHLTVEDLIERGKIPRSGEPLEVLGSTVRVDGKTLFWVKKGLVSYGEEKISLGNALNKVGLLIR